MDGVADLHLDSDLLVIPTRAADMTQLQRVHAADYLDDLCRFCATGGGPLDADTHPTTDSWDAACLAAGAGLVAIDALRERGAGRPLCLPVPQTITRWPIDQWASV